MDTTVAHLALAADFRHTSGVSEALRAENFDELVRLHQQRIYRVLLSLLRDPDAADTLTQECFFRAFQKRASFRGECRVDTWLIRIAVNLATDHVRNRRRAFWSRLIRSDAATEASADVFDCPDPAPSAERQLLAREDAAAMWSVVESLSPQQRVVFVLRFVEEMTLEEISRATELEVGTVKAHLHRAVVFVRQYLRNRDRK